MSEHSVSSALYFIGAVLVEGIEDAALDRAMISLANFSKVGARHEDETGRFAGDEPEADR